MNENSLEKTVLLWNVQSLGTRPEKNFAKFFLYSVKMAQKRFNDFIEKLILCIASSMSLWNKVLGSRNFFVCKFN